MRYYVWPTLLLLAIFFPVKTKAFAPLPAVPTPTTLHFGRPTALFARDKEEARTTNPPPTEEEEDENSTRISPTTLDDEIPPLPTLDASVLIPYFLFLSFWPALAFLRLQLDSLPMPLLDYFDVDKFMALQEMMQDEPQDIIELPALSPAEQMVGAIFGPPPR